MPLVIGVGQLKPAKPAACIITNLIRLPPKIKLVVLDVIRIRWIVVQHEVPVDTLVDRIRAATNFRLDRCVTRKILPDGNDSGNGERGIDSGQFCSI